MIEAHPHLALPKWRRMVLLIAILFCFAFLLVMAAYVQLVPNPELQKEVSQRFERKKTLVALRGKIVDRNYEHLAASIMLVDIEANPRAIAKHKAKLKAKQKHDALIAYEQNLEQAIALLNLDKAKIYKKMKMKRYAGRLPLKNKVDPKVSDEVKALGVAGLYFVEKPYRQYTCHEACGHLIGRQGRDRFGKAKIAKLKDAGKSGNMLPGYLGIEREFNAQLEGEDGYHKFRVAKRIKLEDLEAIATPKNGKDVVLSIDAKIQHLTYEALQVAVEEHAHAKSGAAIVIDAKTGEVLSLATYPSFDPVTGPNAKSGFSNFAVSSVFEPGSTMKSFSVAAAIDAGQVQPSTKVDTAPGFLKFGKFRIEDHGKNYGELTVQEVLQKSSNVGSSKIALELGAEKLWTTYKELGFGQKTQIQFPGEVAGSVRDYQNWRPVSLATNSYGHGISVTLPQLARAYTVFANDGVLLPITLQKLKRKPLGKSVFSKKTSMQIKQMLETVVSDEGTAPDARIDGYRVAGKTGTAYKFDAKSGSYDTTKYISSFVGMAPATNPRVIMAVMIQEPDISKKQHHGGKVAGPVFSEVVLKTLKHMGVKQDIETQQSVAAKKPRGQNARG